MGAIAVFFDTGFGFYGIIVVPAKPWAWSLTCTMYQWAALKPFCTI
jgi:hypothetical protein